MPVAGTPGAQAASLFGQADVQSGALFGQAEQAGQGLLPFFQNEFYNPQGMGATTLEQLLTQAGQSTAGALGGARRTATDLASRTGNLAAIPQIMGGAEKAGITQFSNLSTNLGIQNAMEKLSQQQAGAKGLAGLYGEDIGATEKFEDIANEALKTRISQQMADTARMGGVMQGISQLAGGFAGVAGANPWGVFS